MLLISLCGMVTGCVSVPNAVPGKNCFLYPNSHFSSQTNSTFWAGSEYIGVTNHADFVRVITNFLSVAGQLTLKEENDIRSDPFISTPNLPHLTFTTFDPADRVARYYEKQFSNNGWQEVRGILFVEYCNAGGDWIRVYRKGEALIHIHIVGRWKRDKYELRGLKEGSYVSRLIVFRFVGIEPTAFLGSDYESWEGRGELWPT